MATPATTTPAVATNFDSRIQFAPMYAELHTKGIDFNEAERTKFEEIIRGRAREFNGGSLLSGDLNGIVMRFINMFVYALESLRQNAGGFTMAGFTDWSKARGSETSAFGENKATADMANYIFLDLYNADGKLRQAATLVSGVAMDGSRPTARDVIASNVFTQVASTSTQRADLVNPQSVSLNLNSGVDQNGAAVVPSSGLPRQRALTNTIT
ncbi:MAG: hypothetical protein ACKVOE_03895 [Rickettsiales bacterium]